MELKKKVLKTIKEHDLLKSGDKVVLGFSGGPDSTALFHVLYSLNREYMESDGKKGMSLEIYPVHINHRFRPGAAEEDQKFSEEFASRLGADCRSFVIECNELADRLGIGSEEAGRKARYDSFRNVAEELASSDERSRIKIAVAQNANDQAETVLFRILRGTGTDGLAGIAYKRKDEAGFDIVRPLLDIKREEIEEYCDEEGLEPKIDHTNSEALYTRNKIRLELIPYLEENFNPSIINALNRLAFSALSDKEYLYKQTKLAYEAAIDKGKGGAYDCNRQAPNDKNCKSIFLNNKRDEAGSGCGNAEKGTTEITLKIEKLAELDKSIRYRVYNMALYEIGMYENVTTKFLDAIDKIRLSQNHPRAYTELTGGFRVAREKKRLVFYKSGKTGEF